MKPVLRGVAAATIAVAFALPMSGQTLLRLVPPEGQVSRYVFFMELNVENPLQPVPGPALALRAHLTHTVMRVTPEGIRTGTAIDSASMISILPGVNSANLSGNTFTVERDPRGRLRDVVAEEAADAEAQEFGEPLFQGTDFFWLPEAEVATGDSWTENIAIPVSLAGPAQTVDVELTYTLTGLEGGRAAIAFSGPVEASIDMGGMPANISGELSGSMVVDLTEGRYLRQESSTSVHMSMGGMAVPMETTTTLELVTDPG